MKGIDLFCSSSGSTAVTSSMHHRSTLHRSTKSFDHDRRKSQLHVPCSSQLPINPKPYFEKHRKSSADKQNWDMRRKSSADVNDLYTHAGADGSSRRYLLGDAPFIEWVSESNKISAMVPSQHDVKDKLVVMKRNDPPTLRSSSSARSKDKVFLFFFKFCSLFVSCFSKEYLKRRLAILFLCFKFHIMVIIFLSSETFIQVVVLRVSLHCKACEGKVRKHISKMEGESA